MIGCRSTVWHKFLWELLCAVSATLQVFRPVWFLMSQLVDWVSLEMCGMYWVFSLCGRIGRWRRGSAHGGRRVRDQPWVRHVTHQMTALILVHKDACKSRMVLNLSQAKRIECAVRAAIKLYCTDVSFEWVSPSIFWNSFQETEITTTCQMMWNTMSSNSFAIVSFATAMLKTKTLPTGFTVALCSTAIQYSDRHSNLSFHLLRIVDLLVDVVDVLDVSVSEHLKALL